MTAPAVGSPDMQLPYLAGALGGHVLIKGEALSEGEALQALQALQGMCQGMC